MKKALYLFAAFLLLTGISKKINAQSIALNTGNTTTYCPGGALSIGFHTNGSPTFLTGNTFVLELSNATGSFASATTINTITGTPYTITGNLPAIANGTGYQLRIRSTSPAFITDTLAITINGVGISVTGVHSPNNICNDSLLFTVTSTNSGTSPTYQWQLNGVNVPPFYYSNTYRDTHAQNGDIVTCTVTGNGTCPGTVTSVPDTVIIYPPATCSLTISRSINTGICYGTPLTFTVTPINGGSSPTYQWRDNGVNIPGATGTSYTSSTITTADTFTCVLTSSIPCAPPFVTSTGAGSVQVIRSNDSVVISTPSTTVCSGSNVVFTATPYNGGTSPAYQWQRNGVNIPGATASTYIYGSPATGDTISCIITGSAQCATPFHSNAIVLTATSSLTPVITIAASTGDSICTGTTVTFTSQIVNGGSAPSYTWVKNGVNIPGATASTYTTTSLSNGDVISCVLVSNAGCISSPNTVSQTLTFIVSTAATPTLLITASPGTNITAGTSVTFSATTLNGGSAPAYQWTLNALPVSGATSSTYTTSALVNNDIIGLTMTSNQPCVSPATVTANPLSIKVSSGLETIGSAAIAASIFPEPNQGTFTIRGSIGSDHKEDHVKVVVLNAIGQLVFTDMIPVMDNSINRPETLPGNIASGVYLVQLSIDGQYKTLKLVISK